jgi:lipoprotein NlpD
VIAGSASQAPKPRSKPSASTKNTVEKPQPRLNNREIRWQWPTQGKLRNGYNPAKGKKGLDIEGKEGQPILAAAQGKVVYSGDGLIGYGNLVIIKHNDAYLSAYGHNRRLLVKEGNTVKTGQKIAEMGDSGKQGVILHFEIRRDGKPVDPLRYLPKQGS